MSRDFRKAFRRHPPTTCTACRKELFWDPAAGCYGVDGERLSVCAVSPDTKHLPANGKKPGRFYGDRGGVSRG